MNTTAAETRGSLNTGSITRSLSTGSYDNGDNSATVKPRKVPIYLRASPGSCHDVCKYGKGHHAFEDKPKIPLRKRIAKPSLNEDTFIQILVSGEQNKENVDAKKHSLNAKPSPRRPNARSPNSLTEKTPEIIKREITLPQDSIIDDKMSSSDQKTSDQLLKHPSSAKSKPVKAKPSDGVQPGGKGRASASAKKSPLVPKSSLSKTASNKATQSGRVKSSAPGKDQHTSNTQVAEKIIHVIEIETGNNPLESAPENVSSSQENPSEEEVNGTDDFADNKTLVMETDNTILESFPSSLKSSSHRRSPSSLSSSSKSSFHRRSPSSPSSLSKSSFHRRSPSSSSSSSTKSSPSHRRSPSLLSSSSKSSPSHRRSPSLSKSSFHRRSPSSLSSSSKASPSHRRSPSSSSSKSYSSHSRSPSMTSVEVEEEIKHISKETVKPVSGKRTPSKGTPPRGNLINNVRKTKVVSCDDKPVKLKFRIGKVLDPPQDNNNNNISIARRIKFRRMRSDGEKAEISVSHIQENTKTFLRKSRVVVCEYKRRSPTRLFGGGEKADNNMPLRLRFRRGRIIGADEGKGDTKRNFRNGGGFEGANMKMKLKHQLSDLKGKKDGQCLFNNVIEETATKLAVSKKSKVLALVGAFETVISLHSPRAY